MKKGLVALIITLNLLIPSRVEGNEGFYLGSRNLTNKEFIAEVENYTQLKIDDEISSNDLIDLLELHCVREYLKSHLLSQEKLNEFIGKKQYKSNPEIIEMRDKYLKEKPFYFFSFVDNIDNSQTPDNTLTKFEADTCKKRLYSGIVRDYIELTEGVFIKI